MEPQTILVVGGAGYIGAHTAKAIAERGHRPVVIDNLSTGHAHNARWGPLENADIRDRARLREIFADWRPDAVILFAARAESALGEADPAPFYDTNVTGSLNVLLEAMEAGVRDVIFSSSCTVYGPAEYLPIDTDHACRPFSVYGRTKHVIELALDDFSRVYGLRYAILRYFNASGADPGGEIGEEHDPETHLIPNALRAAFDGRPIKIYGQDYDTPDGTCVRDYIHVTDLAEYHLRALERLRADGRPIVCNLGSGRGCSVLELLSVVEKMTGRTLEREVEPARPGDVPEAVADIEAAVRILGYRPQRSDIETIVSDAWRFHKKRWAKEEASVD